MQQGEALALQKLLTKRFGSIPVELQLKISGATAAPIDIWLDSVFEVTRRLSDLFRRATRASTARRESRTMDQHYLQYSLFLRTTRRDGVIFTDCGVAARLFEPAKRRFTASVTTKKSSPSHS